MVIAAGGNEGDVRNRRGADDVTSNPNPNSMSAPHYMQYGSAEAYAQAVRTWLWAYNSWHLAQTLTPLYVQQAMLNAQCQQRTLPNNFATAHTFANIGNLPVNQVNNPQPQPPVGGTQYIVASYGRRLMAEAIDFCFCFVLKLMIIYFLVEAEYIDLDKYTKMLSDEADLSTFIDVTQDLFPVEVIAKLITSFIEALYLCYGCGSVPAGQTPGKVLSSVKVISCISAYPLAPRDPTIIVVQPGPVHFSASIIRCVIKNFGLSFMFPLCVSMYAFKNNRAIYDLASGTIVVECTQLGIPRRN